MFFTPLDMDHSSQENLDTSLMCQKEALKSFTVTETQPLTVIASKI